MKIQMKSLAAGPSGVMLVGKVYDVPEVEARAFINGKYAIAAPDKPAVPAVKPADKPAEKKESAPAAIPAAKGKKEEKAAKAPAESKKSRAE